VLFAPAAPPPASAAPVAEVHRASRCGECHESYLSQWTASAHAAAARSPVYQAMRARAPEPAGCDRCHAPLAGLVDRAEPVVAEGVTCEVCHTIDDVVLTPGPAEWAPQIARNRKYGPLCDAQPPYFHRTGCSPLHEQSRLCAACHHRAHDAARAAPTVLSEFEEWQHHDAMRGGLHCQGCHMADGRGQVANGGPTRDGVSDHTFPASAGVAVAADLRREQGGLVVVATVTSAGAVHALPVGLPGRQLVLVAVGVDADERWVGEDEAVFTRTLVDERGVEAPFYAAVRQAADTRLQVGEARQVTLRVPAAAVQVKLSLLARPVSPELARTLGVAPPTPRVIETRWLTAEVGR